MKIILIKSKKRRVLRRKDYKNVNLLKGVSMIGTATMRNARMLGIIGGSTVINPHTLCRNNTRNSRPGVGTNSCEVYF